VERAANPPSLGPIADFGKGRPDRDRVDRFVKL
jgi:hypothetical protein